MFTLNVWQVLNAYRNSSQISFVDENKASRQFTQVGKTKHGAAADGEASWWQTHGEGPRHLSPECLPNCEQEGPLTPNV